MADRGAGFFEPGAPAGAEALELAPAQGGAVLTTNTKKATPSRRRTPEPAARPARADARDRRIIELERENWRLAQALAQLQERVSQLLGIPLEGGAKE